MIGLRAPWQKKNKETLKRESSKLKISKIRNLLNKKCLKYGISQTWNLKNRESMKNGEFLKPGNL